MLEDEKENTIIFDVSDKEKAVKEILTEVYEALKEKGYNPVNQIVGYILSEDPTYITTHKNARSLIRKVDRYDIVTVFLKNYLNIWIKSARLFPRRKKRGNIIINHFFKNRNGGLYYGGNKKRFF